MAKINTTNYQPVTAWNGTQDLFVVEQPDGTKVATPEQVKQYVLNDMDNVPTSGSSEPVKSGGVKTYVDNAVATKHNTDTVAFTGMVPIASNFLGTITASSLGISDCTKYNWDIRSKSWEAFPQIANVTASGVTFYVRWLSSTSGGTVSLKNSGDVQIILTGMTRYDI